MANLMDGINNINTIKKELSELPLDPREKDFLENSISPITDLLYKLSASSLSLASSADILSKSYITKPKKGKLKKTNETVYDINETCNELFKIIKKRIDLLK